MVAKFMKHSKCNNSLLYFDDNLIASDPYFIAFAIVAFVGFDLAITTPSVEVK